MKKINILIVFFVIVTLVSFSEVVLTIASGAVGIELELTKIAAEKYMEINPNVKIEIIEIPDMTDDRFRLFLHWLDRERSDVDIYQIDVIWPGELGDYFVDFNQFDAHLVTSLYYQEMIKNNIVDNRLIALPWFSDAGLLYYRKDLLEKYNLDIPKTWDELEEYALIIQKGEREEGNPDFWGYVWQGNAYEGLTCNALEWIVSNDGGNIIEPDGRITIYNDNAIEILDKVSNWVGRISPTAVTGFDEEASNAVWLSGNAAFMRNWPYAYTISQSEESQVKNKFDVARLPKGRGDHAATLGGWQLAVSKYSNNIEEAVEFAFFLTGYEIQKMRAIQGSFNPTIQSLYLDTEVLKANPFFRSFYDVFDSAVRRPAAVTAPNYTEFSRLFYEAVHEILNRRRPAAIVLEELAIDLEDLTGLPIEW